MAFFTLDDVQGFYHPENQVYTPGVSAEALCRFTGLAGDNDSDTTVVSEISEHSSRTPSPTRSATFDYSAPVSRGKPCAHKQPRVAKKSTQKQARAPNLSARQEVNQGFKANKLARKIFDTSVRMQTIGRHTGLSNEETEAAVDAVVSGDMPFQVCAERLRDVVRDVVCVQEVPGRTNYEPATNTDVDFVPVGATELVTDGADGDSFELREGACVAALFVAHRGQWYVVQLSRNEDIVVVVGGDGDADVSAVIAGFVVAWANQAGWGAFVASQIIPVAAFAPSHDLKFEFGALVAYWLVAVTYAQRADSEARRYLRILDEISGVLNDANTRKIALANTIGNLTKVLLTSRFRLSRDIVMRNFVPFRC